MTNGKRDTIAPPVQHKRTIFVTVGTTRFDRLIEKVTASRSLEWMKVNGYTHLVVQYGTGNEPSFGIPSSSTSPTDISCRAYRFQDSLQGDMRDADLILCHAGAGTVMEGLTMKKRMVVVINSALMDNHQTELAHAMASRGHLFVIENPDDLDQIELWNDMDSFVSIPLPKREETMERQFATLLDAHMGIS